MLINCCSRDSIQIEIGPRFLLLLFELGGITSCMYVCVSCENSSWFVICDVLCTYVNQYRYPHFRCPTRSTPRFLSASFVKIDRRKKLKKKIRTIIREFVLCPCLIYNINKLRLSHDDLWIRSCRCHLSLSLSLSIWIFFLSFLNFCFGCFGWWNSLFLRIEE